NMAKIPGDFFTTQSPIYNLTSERSIGDSLYFDRLEIKVQKGEPSSLIISHNVSENLEEVINIQTLFDSGFKQKIENMHSYNKQMLTELLQVEVQSLIGLTTQQNQS